MNFRYLKFLRSCQLPIAYCLLPIACCLLSISSIAQTPQRHKIAIFTPLYLDSAFDATGNFKYNEKNYARFVNAGLEFYIGVQAALDSLQKRGAPLEVHVIDLRAKKGLMAQLADSILNNVELIIAQSNSIETKTLADFAFRKKIPFISTTFPNDAGVGNNPYFVVLNSTLQTHVEGIYRFIQKNYPNQNILLFTKNGTQEEQIKNYFSDFSKATLTSPLNIKFVNVEDASNPSRFLDSNKKNICITGSMDESFGSALAAELSFLSKTYPVTLIGMPTWDNFNLNKQDYNGLEIIYTAPFQYSKNSNFLASKLSTHFTNKMSNSPGDMFYRGYESTLRFSMLLLDTKKDIASNLTRRGNTIFTQFDIQPHFKDSNNMVLDYFENKNLYFIKVQGGARTVLY